MTIKSLENSTRPPQPSAQPPRLSARSSKEDFLAAIRDAASHLGRKPFPAELRGRMGPVFDILSDKYFPTAFTAIQAAFTQRPSTNPLPLSTTPMRAPDSGVTPKLVSPLFLPDAMPRPEVKVWNVLKQVMAYPAWRYGYIKELWRKNHGNVSVPNEVVLIGHKRGAANDCPVGAIALLSVEEAAARVIPQPYFQITLTDVMRRVISVKGVGALELGGVTMFGRDLTPIELAVVARVWGTQYQSGKNKLTWELFLNQVSAVAQKIVPTLWHAQRIAELGRMVGIPDDLVLLVRREGRGDAATANGLRMVTLEEYESESEVQWDSSIGKVFLSWDASIHRHVVVDVQDAGAFDTAVAIVGGQVGGLDEYERNLLSMLFGSRARTGTRPDGVEAVNWNGIKSRVAGNIDTLFKRYWQIRRIVEPSLPASPERLTLIVRRRDENKVNEVGGIRLLQPDEVKEADLGSHVVRLEGKLNANGAYYPSYYAGWGGQELYNTAIGGITLAPDAEQMDEASRRFSPQTENFGNLDGQVCKPEPLITPADVMPVPQLDRPTNEIKLPKMEGFVGTDPEVVKKFQTPPSDRIPVITGPREEEVSVDLPEFVGADLFLPEPPLGMVVSGYAILGGVMLLGPVVEAVAAIDVSVEVPVGVVTLFYRTAQTLP